MTKIQTPKIFWNLELIPVKKGLRYSTGDHAIRDLNVTSWQLTLNNVWYTFDWYYQNGNVKASIKMEVQPFIHMNEQQ